MTATVIRISDRLTLQEPPTEEAAAHSVVQTLKLLARFQRTTTVALLTRLVHDEARRVLGRDA